MNAAELFAATFAIVGGIVAGLGVAVVLGFCIFYAVLYAHVGVDALRRYVASSEIIEEYWRAEHMDRVRVYRKPKPERVKEAKDRMAAFAEKLNAKE